MTHVNNSQAASSQSRTHLSARRARLGNALKRAFDVLAAGLGLLFLSPFFLLLALLIKRDSPGPVFYRGLRVGRGGRNFQMLKFRTMNEGPENQNGLCVTAQDDPRITPLGRWLRETKWNELPQLWNVLKGEMSLVGPRPEDPQIVTSWPEEMRREILSVRPGITSPASVIYRDEEKSLRTQNVMDDYLRGILPDKLRLDQLYIRHRTFLTDLDVIFWTLVMLLPQIRRAAVAEKLLYTGPLYNFFRRFFSWFLIDSLVAFGAIALSGLIWRTSGPLNLGVGVAFGAAVGIALLFSAFNSVLGLGRVSWEHASPANALELAFSSGLVTLALTLVDQFWPPRPLVPLGMVWVSGLLAFLGFLVVRYRERLITGLASRWLQYRGQTTSAFGERILIVGAGEHGQLTAWLLKKSSFFSMVSIVGMVDDNPRKQGVIMDGHPVLGSTRDIPAIVAKKDIGLILFAIYNIQPADQARIVKLCQQTPARLVVVPDLLRLLHDQLFQPVEAAS